MKTLPSVDVEAIATGADESDQARRDGLTPPRDRYMSS